MNPAPLHRFPRYGTLGLLMLVLMETAVFCAASGVLPHVRWELLTAWTTPVCWWGYLLLVDAAIYRKKGTSPLTARRRTVVLQCGLSVAFWCLFEGYNRLLPGWQYLNLDPHLGVRFLGYALAFATIMPGLFLTCELVQCYGVFARARCPEVRWSHAALTGSLIVGAVFVVVPPFCPAAWRGYLWAFIWSGWVLLLEPLNYRRGLPSLYRDWERGQLARTLQLALAGLLCGLLWEFWNMWAYTKWVYIFPLGQNWKLYEMPLVGFLGFPPFALEYFVMFHFVSSFYTTEDKLEL